MTFTLATWNINSVRLREGLVAKLLSEESPDVLCLQECKSPVDKIPTEAFSALGYRHMAARGQKGYNGVAILSKLPLKEVAAFDFADLGHARHIAAELENGVTIHNFYVPAGGDIPDREANEKFGQKLDYLTQMRDWLHVEDHARGIDLVLHEGKSGEAYNVAGEDLRYNIDVVHKMLDLLEKPQSLIKYVRDREGHDRRYAMDAVKLRELGWERKHTFETGLQETIKWYLDNEWWWRKIKSGEFLEYYKRQYADRIAAAEDK